MNASIWGALFAFRCTQYSRAIIFDVYAKTDKLQPSAYKFDFVCIKKIMLEFLIFKQSYKKKSFVYIDILTNSIITLVNLT